jgi:hypothetical protein
MTLRSIAPVDDIVALRCALADLWAAQVADSDSPTQQTAQDLAEATATYASLLTD